MAVPTDAMITSWKGRRTTAANNFQLVVDRVDPLVNEGPDPDVMDIDHLLGELEVKFSTYEKAHDKIVDHATDAQMGRDDYGNTIAAQHEDLLTKLEAADQKLKLKKKGVGPGCRKC